MRTNDLAQCAACFEQDFEGRRIHRDDTLLLDAGAEPSPGDLVLCENPEKVGSWVARYPAKHVYAVLIDWYRPGEAPWERE